MNTTPLNDVAHTLYSNGYFTEYGVIRELIKERDALLAGSVSPAVKELVALNLDYDLLNKKYVHDTSALQAQLNARDEEIAVLVAELSLSNAKVVLHTGLDQSPLERRTS